MPAKKSLTSETSATRKASPRMKRKTVKAAEPVVVLTESPASSLADESGMITSGGVEVIGLLALVSLIYATFALYLVY